jgi:hypothetical protein
MTEITRIEARYVVRSRLANLLQKLFGDPINYTVKVFMSLRPLHGSC